MPVKSMLLFLAVLPILAQAESGQASNDGEQPDLSLLEFLGSFEAKDNVWLDVVIDETETAQAELTQEVNNHE